MAYIGTQECQQRMAYNFTYVPALRDIENADLPDYLYQYWASNQHHPKFIIKTSYYEDILPDTVDLIWEAMKTGSSEGLKEKFIETADTIHQAALVHTTNNQLGEVAEKFSGQDTVRLYNRIIQEAAGADFALNTVTGVKDGVRNTSGLCAVNLYPGTITRHQANTGMAWVVNTIQTVTLTGAEVEEILRDGKKMGETAVFPYSSAALDITRDSEENFVSARLNGKPLEAGKTYTVAFLARDFPSGFESAHEITDTQLVIEDVVAAYMTAHSPLRPER